MFTDKIIKDCMIDSRFWTPIFDRMIEKTIPHAVKMCEKPDGGIANMINAERKNNGLSYGCFKGKRYRDSDVYKVAEGMFRAINLNLKGDGHTVEKEGMRNILDKWIGYIAGMQENDGYIDSFFTLNAREDCSENITYFDDRFPFQGISYNGDKRLWDFKTAHEIYCMGHMMELAATAFEEAGETRLINVAEKAADKIWNEFGPNGKKILPGHPEIELALLRLSRCMFVLGKKEKAGRYIKLARYIIESYGDYSNRYGICSSGEENYMDHAPLKSQNSVKGHAIKAEYIMTGVAGLSLLDNDSSWNCVLDNMWQDMREKAYLTGGYGTNEEFSNAHNLTNYGKDNDGRVSESCSACGNIFFQWSLYEVNHKSANFDSLEQSLYNCLLAAVSLSGDRFFYHNPLTSEGFFHRREWYNTACCPGNVMRTLAALPNFILASDSESLYVNIYVGGRYYVDFGNSVVDINIKTDYPLDGSMEIEINCEKAMMLKLRVPDWCESYQAESQEEALSLEAVDGYLSLQIKKGKTDIKFTLDMPVKIMPASKQDKINSGKCILKKGPMVYCLEGCDNEFNLDEYCLDKSCELNVSWVKDSLEGTAVIDGRDKNGRPFIAIPYYLWDNREAGAMRVWVDYS